MNNLNKTLIMATIATLMGSSFAATDSINLKGFIAKAVSVEFAEETLDLGDMKSASSAEFKVIANTDYTVSAPEEGTLVNKDTEATLGYKIEVSKEKSVMVVTPAEISAEQAAGNYSGNVVLTVSAV